MGIREQTTVIRQPLGGDIPLGRASQASTSFRQTYQHVRVVLCIVRDYAGSLFAKVCSAIFNLRTTTQIQISIRAEEWRRVSLRAAPVGAAHHLIPMPAGRSRKGGGIEANQIRDKSMR